MNINPFSDKNEETSFEQGAPVSQAAKNAAKAAGSQVNTQIKAANQDIVSQLYAPTTQQEPGTDETNTQQSDQTNVSRAGANGQSGKQANINPNQPPEEQAKMEKIRKELFGNYSAKFQVQNGAQNITTNLEQEMEKARREREQKETQRKQAEEEEEQRKKEEEEAQQQELDMPAGKKTGFMFGKKQQQPMAVQIAKTRTEVNRGTTG